MLIIRPLVIVHTTDRNILDLLRGLLNNCLQTRVYIDQGVVLSMRYVCCTVSRVWAEDDVPIYSSKNSPLSHDLNEKRRTAGTETSQSSLAHRQSGNRSWDYCSQQERWVWRWRAYSMGGLQLSKSNKFSLLFPYAQKNNLLVWQGSVTQDFFIYSLTSLLSFTAVCPSIGCRL